jgi:selenide,water dikinase
LFQPGDYPNLLVGLAKADDAAVYQLNETQAIITTTDFFPPVVDDPYDFGAIAAANAMSDIYAMGGEVLFAINLVAFPDHLGMDLLSEILRGGAEKVAEGGGVIAGGHSVNDKEPKYGLAVTGIIHPKQVKAKSGAAPGDVLLLTKPLGVGVITTALKKESASPQDVQAAVNSMKTLNRQAALAAQLANARSMTDITGFGLIGHAREMAVQGQVNFHFQADRFPWLPGALEYGQQGCFPGGTKRNASYFSPFVDFGPNVSPLIQNLLMTPETSGGLLVSVPANQVQNFIDHCVSAIEVGNVEPGDGRLIVN